MELVEENENLILGLQASQFKNKCELVKVVHDITEMQVLTQDIVEQLRKSTNANSDC
jgi:hypothetical protein